MPLPCLRRLAKAKKKKASIKAPSNILNLSTLLLKVKNFLLVSLEFGHHFNFKIDFPQKLECRY